MVHRAGSNRNVVSGVSGDGTNVTVADVEVAWPLVGGLESSVDSKPVHRNAKERGVAGGGVGLVVANWVRVNVVGVSVTYAGVHEHTNGDVTGARVVQVGLTRSDEERSDELELNNKVFSFHLVSPRRPRRPTPHHSSLRRTRKACHQSRSR